MTIVAKLTLSRVAILISILTLAFGAFFVAQSLQAASHPVVETKPDLVIFSVEYSAIATDYAGYPFDGEKAQVLVQNQGNEDAGEFAVWLHVKETDTDLLQCGQAVEVAGLKAGEIKGVIFDYNEFINCANLEAGDYYLEAVADDTSFGAPNKVDESDETNNSKRTEDFAVLPFPSNPFINNITTANLALGETRISFDVISGTGPTVIYSSEDEFPQNNFGDPFVSSYKHQITAISDGGGKYHADIPTSPNTLYHYRILLANTNVTTFDLTFETLPSDSKKPDLTIKDIYFYPSNPVLGKKFTGEIRLKISNIGNSAVQVVPGECLYESSLKIDSTSPVKDWLGTDLSIGLLKQCGPTISGDGQISYGLKDVVFNNSITLSAVIDFTKKIDESNENNNTLSKTVLTKIIDLLPDLVVEEVFFSPLPVKGEFYTGKIKLKVANRGNVRTQSSGGIHVSTVMSRPNKILIQEGIDNSRIIGDMNAGESFYVIFPVKNVKFIDNTVTLRSWVDSNSVVNDNGDPINDNLMITESNENNNTLSKVVYLSRSPVITMQEWVDYHDPFGVRLEPSIISLIDKYNGQVDLEIRHFPLEGIHPGASKIAEAVLCVQDQGDDYFWPLHRWLMSIRFTEDKGIEETRNYISRELADGNFNLSKFNNCLDSGTKKEIVDNSRSEGESKGVVGVPNTFIIRNRDGKTEEVKGAQPYDEFRVIIERLIDDSTTRDDADKSDEITDPTRLSEIAKLRTRIRKLERKISSLERQVVESEKRLTRKINQALTKRLRGRILLQVENNGEAWYVDEITEERFYLRDGDAAYSALQAFGLGITNSDLELIPIGVEERAEIIDSDGDGLDDQLEEAIGSDPNNPDTDGDGFTDGAEVKQGFNPNGIGRLTFNSSLADRLEGKILLQVEGKGEAWYIHNGQRHYMKNGRLAYQIMRFLSLGITNDDIRQIAVGELE